MTNAYNISKQKCKWKPKIKLKTIQNIKTTKGMSIKIILTWLYAKHPDIYIYINAISFPCSMLNFSAFLTHLSVLNVL